MIVIILLAFSIKCLLVLKNWTIFSQTLTATSPQLRWTQGLAVAPSWAEMKAEETHERGNTGLSPVAELNWASSEGPSPWNLSAASPPPVWAWFPGAAPVAAVASPLSPLYPSAARLTFEDLRHSENQVGNFAELHTMWPFVSSAVPIAFASVLISIY
jgi:hypothetical protein